jgi:hypothetical protein
MPNTNEEIINAINNKFDDIYNNLSYPTVSEITLRYPALYKHIKIENELRWDIIWPAFIYCNEVRCWNHYQCEFLNDNIAGDATDDNHNGIITKIEQAISEACWASDEFNKDKEANDKLTGYLTQAKSILASMREHEISFKETENRLNKFLEDFNNRKKEREE